jgi:RND family efflux transporter MFP subunit
MVAVKRKSRRIVIAAGVGVLVTTTLLMSSCGKKEKAIEKPAAARPAKIMILGASEQGDQRSFPGKVQASREVDLSFEVTGKIIEIPVKKGQAVEKGQILARLDPRDFENTVAKQKARFDNAKVNLERAQRLLSSGSVSQAEVDNRKTTFEMTEAELKIAEKALRDTYIKAPYAGLVANKYADNHQFVQAKQKILSLQDVSQIEIVVNIPEDMAAHAKDEGVKRLYAEFESVPGSQFELKIKEYGTDADPQTQTFPVTMTMPAPKGVNILPGMTATVTVVGLGRSVASADHFVIPVSAVLADETGKPHVWVVDKSSMIAHTRAVKTGALTGDGIKVLDGLKSGEMIITAGVDHVRENMMVRPMESRTGAKK